ncbi:MAG: hypothetical protein AABW51_02375 [Nanoarchaeota archaeon]
MTKIFDSQMNLGRNVFGPDSTIEDYLDNAHAEGVIKTIAIPTGTHELRLPSGIIERSCLWSKDYKGIVFRRILLNENGDILEEQTNPTNPYSLMNAFCYANISELNNKQNKIMFYFCPKLHPTLDTEDEVSKYLPLKEVVAFKIQGLSSYTTTKDVPYWLIRLLKTSHKPLMIHTDYRAKKRADGLDEIVKGNRASAWANWAVQNNLKCYLAHGLCLDAKAIDIVNNSELFMVGLGPDLMLNQEKNSLAIYNVDYLTFLFSKVKPEKICFNYDYRWNVLKRGEWNSLDWDSPHRIKECAIKLGRTESFLRNILFNNAMGFFNIGEEK